MKRSYKRYFEKAIQRNFAPSSNVIMSAIEAHYEAIAPDTQFSFRSSNPVDRRLDFCAYFLALIKTLDERGETYETIRLVSLEVVTEYVSPRNAFQRLMKKLPVKLIGTWLGKVMVRKFAERVRQNENKEGFIAEIITDHAATYGLGYGVDILECGICKLYNKHHYGKYAPILCEVDKLTSSLAGLELIRTSTIALGATKCDFRYRKLK